MCGSSHRSRLGEEVTRLAAPLQPRTQLPVREADECLQLWGLGVWVRTRARARVRARARATPKARGSKLALSL